MLLNLKIPDSLYDHYLTKFSAPTHYLQMKRAIEEFKNVAPGDRILLLAGEGRKSVEALFEIPVESADQLVRLIKNMASVKIEGREITLTQGQLYRLSQVAKTYGQSTEDYIQTTIARVLDEY